MTDQPKPKFTPTKTEKSPSVKVSNNNDVPTKKEKSPTEKKAYQHNKIKQDDLVKWTVFVEPETKTAVTKAAARADITLTDWLNSRLRQMAVEELTTKHKPPIKVEEVADVLKQFTDKMEAAQAASAEETNAIIKGQRQEIAELKQTVTEAVNRPQPTFRQMLFGRKKEG